MNIVSPETSALKDLNSTLAKNIDETISGALGQSAMESFFDHLKLFYCLRKYEAAHSLDIVSRVFEKNFGSTVSNVLGRTIARGLHHELKLGFTDRPNGNLPECGAGTVKAWDGGHRSDTGIQ